jgi:allophanate hydrolase subunit 2
MDRAAFAALGGGAAIEFSSGGIGFAVEGAACRAAFGGGDFRLTVSGKTRKWPGPAALNDGDVVEITTGRAGNYGYVRFDREIEVPAIMGSRATSLVAGLGGREGRALRVGDILTLGEALSLRVVEPVRPIEGPIRIVWGLHADLFPADLRTRFIESAFTVTSRMDRMGVRLADASGVFANIRALSLVSDAIVPGDIQILGDGTPIVLMRDHQPTGGYPRIATAITADLDRFAQLRPGAEVRFAAVTLDKARAALLSLPA